MLNMKIHTMALLNVLQWVVKFHVYKLSCRLVYNNKIFSMVIRELKELNVYGWNLNSYIFTLIHE